MADNSSTEADWSLLSFVCDSVCRVRLLLDSPSFARSGGGMPRNMFVGAFVEAGAGSVGSPQSLGLLPYS